jgi:hypothetical protein
MSSWWDRTDPTDRPELTNRAPAGLVESWWNVVAGAVLLIGLPVIVLSGGSSPARIAFALFGLAVMVALELVFLRKLRQRIAGRRALRLVTADHEVASSGEIVDFLADDPESGWSWCRNADGREGWVPHRVLTAA